MTVKRVWIEAGCICCQLSVDNCPAVFEIPDGSDTAVVKAGVDPAAHSDAIKAAAEACPVEVIKYEEG